MFFLGFRGSKRSKENNVQHTSFFILQIQYLDVHPTQEVEYEPFIPWDIPQMTVCVRVSIWGKKEMRPR